MKRFGGYIPLIALSVIAFYSTTTLGSTTPNPNCPSIGRLRYEAAKYVAEFFRQEADRIQSYIEAALQNKRNAKQALTQCYAEIESAKSLKEARITQAAKLSKDIQRLEAEKAAIEAERDRAFRDFNNAKNPHMASSTDAARARYEAEAALKIANQRAKEAAEAWAEANAAQQSTKWVPATNAKPGHHRGHQQTAVSYRGGQNPSAPQAKVAPDAAKLTEKAKSAEYAAAVAQAEAKRLSDIAKAAAEASRSVYDKMSPSAHAYHQAEAQYNAICLSYAQAKASYDAAVLSINDATNLIFAKQAALADAKARIKAEGARIGPLKEQLATVLAVANYAQSLAERVKEQTYFTSTVEADTTTGLEPTTTEMPMTTTMMTAVDRGADAANNNIPSEFLAGLQNALRAAAQQRRALGNGRRGLGRALAGARARARAPAMSPAFLRAMRNFGARNSRRSFRRGSNSK